MSRSGKPSSDLGFDALANRFRNSATVDDDKDTDDSANKPDFRELDLGSPVSPLGTRSGGPAGSGLTTTSSSSSSSGSVSVRNVSHPLSKVSHSSHSGELSASVEGSPTARRPKPALGRSRSTSSGSHPQAYTGGSVNSPPVNVLPTGNICPSGKILKTGMASRSSKTDVLGSGTVNYGHGSIMRGNVGPKSPGGGRGRDGGSAGASTSRGTPPEGKSNQRLMNSNDPEELKMAGNEQHKKGNFSEALNFYERAIALSPGVAAYHCNRAAALIGLRRLTDAIKECEEALRLDPGYVRAHHRLGSLYLSLGQVEIARAHICFAGHNPDPSELKKLQAVEKHLTKCTGARRFLEWKTVLREADAAIAAGADSSPQLFACRAEAHLKLHLLDDADMILSHAPKFELSSRLKFFGIVSDAYLYMVRSKIEIAFGRFESAIAAIDKARRIDAESNEISNMAKNVRLVMRARARGNDLFKSERFTEASAAYSDGLMLDPTNSVLFCNRAACWYKLGQWEKSVEDCDEALRFQPKYNKALLRRATSNTKLERWGEAVRDYEILRREHPQDREVAESLFHAQIALKKSRGEDVHDMKFGGEVELISSLDHFRAAISSPCASVILFKAESNPQCKQISTFLDALCSRYPSINFFKVDMDGTPAIAEAESVRVVPTVKIYLNGNRVKEIVCPSQEGLETSVKHYSF